MTEPPAEMHVQSVDGTRIGVLALGAGPPIVIVHGSLTTGKEWLPVACALADRFTCYVMTRRGRGRSGDGSAYSLEEEWHDIQAVLEVAGGRAHLVGHSYGAVCALEAARRCRIGRLVLYEPPLPIDRPIVGPALLPLRQAVQARRFDAALAIGLRALLRLSDERISGLRGTPLWEELVALTPGAVRELEIVEDLEPGVERFRVVTSPTLLLVGDDTAPHHKTSTAALQRTLTDVRTALLEGHGHQAHLDAPELVARHIADFLQRP